MSDRLRLILAECPVVKKFGQEGMSSYKSCFHPDRLSAEVLEAVDEVAPYGSVEIFVQDSKVTQITRRRITKTR